VKSVFGVSEGHKNNQDATLLYKLNTAVANPNCTDNEMLTVAAAKCFVENNKSYKISLSRMKNPDKCIITTNRTNNIAAINYSLQSKQITNK
jgi:hypothetical protein